ncbi:CIA30 family protein [Halomonas sp. LS-001]
MALTFQGVNEQAHWFSVDDGVMGGISHSGFSVANGIGCFQGDVSLENGGGFASVRRQPDDFETTLTKARGISLRVCGDGRTYQLRVKSTQLNDASAYRVRFTPTHDGWETLYLPWENFEAVRRGTLLTDAPSLHPSGLTQIGFLIADRTAGPFCLQVSQIEAL